MAWRPVWREGPTWGHTGTHGCLLPGAVLALACPHLSRSSSRKSTMSLRSFTVLTYWLSSSSSRCQSWGDFRASARTAGHQRPLPAGGQCTCPGVGFFPPGKLSAGPPSGLQASGWGKGLTSLRAGPCPLSLLPKCWPQWDTGRLGPQPMAGAWRAVAAAGRSASRRRRHCLTPAEGAAWPRAGRDGSQAQRPRDGAEDTARECRS